MICHCPFAPGGRLSRLGLALLALGVSILVEAKLAASDLTYQLDALHRAVADLTASFPEQYPNGPEYLRRLAQLRQQAGEGHKVADAIQRLRREALLANPLLGFDELIVLKRKRGQLGLPTNHQGNSSLKQKGYDNEIAVLSPVRPGGKLRTLYQPGDTEFIRDHLVDDEWPKFLHPYPLSEKYFLAAGWQSAKASWGIYVVDVFGDMVRVLLDPRHDFFEPIPLRPAPKPPVLPSRVDLDRDDAIVYLHDVYAGPGLAGVPRGTVRRLRVAAYHFGYPGLAGPDKIGCGGPWEVMRILGTVPVHDDGSAAFRAPAQTPLTIQSLDADGQAVSRAHVGTCRLAVCRRGSAAPAGRGW